jgi:signal transduction histidine kinase
VRFATKIGLSAAAAALIIGPLLGAVMFLNARALLLERIIDEQLQRAAAVMGEIDQTLATAYADMNVIAADNFLREILESASVGERQAGMVADELEEKARLTGPWDGMSVYDRGGRVVFAPTGVNTIGALAESHPTRIAFAHALSGKPYYSDRIECRRTGRSVVIFAAPIFGQKNPDKVVGVLASRFVMTPIQSVLDKVEAPATVHLLDSKGVVIGQRSGDHLDVRPLQLPRANPARTALAGGDTGYVIQPLSIHGGGASLVVDVRQKGANGYRGVGWTLMLEMPLEVIFAPIVTMARNTGLLVVGVLLAMGALFAILGRRFIRPLSSLVEGVRQVEQGRLDQKVTVRSKDEFGELADGFNAMVDKLREAQEELVRKEKLAMLGQVASSVGHELRNPMGVMSNAVYFLQTMLDGADDSIKEYLGIIRDEIARSERIVADLMDAVHPRPPERVAFGLAEVVDQVLRKCAIPSSVTVSLDIPGTLPAVLADATQMQRVFENLVSNAIDAMPEGGALEIRARRDAQARAVAISVRDTGTGIAPDVMPLLFEPLFTTKARGIGLGLVVAKNLIEANSGTVKVESEVGNGTLVTVILPSDGSAGETA